MHTLKKSILSLLEANDLDSLVTLAKDKPRVVSLLVRISYDKETLAGWRAIKAVGLISRELVRTDYEYLRNTIRKLRWSLSDESGGIGWSAPELNRRDRLCRPSAFCRYCSFDRGCLHH